MLIFITSCLVAIIVSFLCSLAEAVLLSLNPIRLETLNQQGKAHASIWIKLRQNIGRPIAAILILNTIAHTGGATVAGSAFDEINGDEWIWLFSTVFTIVILFGTEIIPKMIGVTLNEKLAPWIGPVLRASITVLKPIIALTELLSRIFERTESHTSRMGAEDIRTLARIAKTQGTIEDEQERIILSAAKLRETKVESVMIPREWIIFLRTHQSIQENFEIVPLGSCLWGQALDIWISNRSFRILFTNRFKSVSVCISFSRSFAAVLNVEQSRPTLLLSSERVKQPDC